MTGEPTLHYGDHDADGWVEYLQQLLLATNPDLASDGIFGDQTIHAVYAFQQANNLMVDGVVGNQTWSVLRGGDQQPVGTDGHQHQESDARMHVVFYLDQTSAGETGMYIDSDDAVWFLFSCVGSVPIPDNEYYLNVNLQGPDGSFDHHELPMHNINDSGKSEPGDLVMAKLEQIKAAHGAGEYSYAAEVPPGIGSEQHEGRFTVA